MMRVLLISHTCQSRTEGQPKAQWLGSRPGVDLRVLTPDRWRHYGRPRGAERPSEASFQLEVGRVRWPWVPGAQFYAHYYPQLGAILREFRPHVIDLWEEPWALVSAHACWLRNRIVPEAKIVAETEQNISKTLPPPFETFRNYVHRQADFLIGRSSGAVAMSRSKGYRGPTAVVPNGCDTSLFIPLDRAECRKKVLEGLRPHAVVAGYVGRLVPEKGLEDLLDALLLCPESVQLLFVGDGPMRDVLLAKSAALGVAHRVGVQPARRLDELPVVMNALDMLVLPSRTTARWKEQFGRVIIEAHACGTPVIGSDSGAIPDVVGEGGLIARECDPTALAQALTTLASDASLRSRMGAVGRRRVLNECSWQQVASQMAAIYDQVAHSIPPREVSATARIA